MLQTNTTARKIVSTLLMTEAKKHEEAAFEDLGKDYDMTEIKLSDMEITDKDVGLAMIFWDAWLDERNHNFVGHYKGIEKTDWPKLAKSLANYLVKKIETIDPTIEEHFRFV